MPRPRVYKTQAIVLRQRKLGEADKIVTLYTAHGGKVDAVAKGVRRTKSRLAGNLEPLTLGSYLLAEGRELDIVTQAETVDAFPALRDGLERISRGLYCAELVDRLTPDRAESNSIFRLLYQTLGYLSTNANYDLAVRRWATGLP
jgi:DNA repair protein RecO (recombination protein O)